MKIAVNTRFLLKNRLEGVGRFTFEILKEMVEQHPEDEFFFLFDRPYDKSFIFASNITPLCISPPARHPFLFYYWFEMCVPSILKTHNIDVFLSPDGFLSLKADTPTVLVTHDLAYEYYPEFIPFLMRKYFQYFMPKFAQRADRTIAVSNATKQDLIQQYKIPSSKIEIAYNACSQHFNPINPSIQKNILQKYTAGKPYFLYLGSIHPRKNIARLIQAFTLFKKNNSSPIKLLIGGRMAWKTAKIKTAYQQSPFQEDIIFQDYIPESALPKIIGSALAMVYISLYEGFGIPLLEAMHCGVPIITSNVSSMPEVVGNAALKVDPKNLDAIALAMTKIASDKMLRQQLIALGHQEAMRFSWEDSARTIYQNLGKAIEAFKKKKIN